MSTSNDVIVEEAPDRVERRSIVVNTTPDVIFDLLADPSRHHEIDGSGTVQASKIEGPPRLSPGAKFGMKMKYGVPYTITNTVVDFEENRQISWRHLGRHVWRYTLEAVDGASSPQTRVTEEFDWRPALFAPGLKLINAPRDNAEAIEATLKRLAALFD